jgi:hypothetical protein
MDGGVKDAKKEYTRMLRKGCVIFLKILRGLGQLDDQTKEKQSNTL